MPDRSSTARLWRRHWLLALYALLALAVAAQRYLLHKANVFLIYRTSFSDLLGGVNLYAAHPGAYWDFFRYSPTFALLFAPLAVLPVPAGLALWCLVNFLALYAAVWRLLPERQAKLVLLVALGDLIRSMQSCQSNALIAALMIAAFLAYERDRPWRGAWAVTAATMVKLFPASAGLFALLGRGRGRALAALALAGVALVLLPLPITGPHLLVREYGWWMGLERAETYKPMRSVMDLMDAWTGGYWPRWPIMLAGLLVTLLPVVLRRDAWTRRDFQLRLLGSLLCFSVLFNYGAEAPSYVISTTGIAIWYSTGPRRPQHDVLLLLTLLLVTAPNLDLLPSTWRDRVIDPARLMVVPVLAAWLLMQVEMLTLGRTSQRAEGRENEIGPGQAPA